MKYNTAGIPPITAATVIVCHRKKRRNIKVDNSSHTKGEEFFNGKGAIQREMTMGGGFSKGGEIVRTSILNYCVW